MAVLFDARSLDGEMTGITRYALGLLRGIADLDPSRKIFLLGKTAGGLSKAFAGRGCFEFVNCDLPAWSIHSQIKLPKILRKIDCRIYHCPDVFAPLFVNGPSIIITLHDLIPARCRSMLRNSRKGRLYPLWDAWLRLQCANASAIITVSNASRKDIFELLKVPFRKVWTIYNGVQEGQTRISMEDIRERFALGGEIISYIGRHDPYKNLVTLVEAFKVILQKSGRNLHLIIGGKIDRRYIEARRRAEQLGLGRRVVFTDYLDEDWRIALLRGSSVFVYPSLYEGFGLPPLEAMCEGVPVVASNATSLPEVLGQAALLVDARRPEALAEAVLEIIENEHVRHRLVESGYERVSHFSWKRCAQQHLELYEALLT
jgi:glycosyltransferase involved in cell wall biosynthesis